MKSFFKIILLFIIYCYSVVIPYSQNPDVKCASHWYFGNRAGLDFTSGNPVADINGVLDSWESCASISDIDGNLLFYSDGDTVWDKNHNVMPNGTGLFGNCLPPGPNNSATQGVIIIPEPNSNNIFYLFTVDCAENLGMKGMNYSIVDLNQNSGFGDVILKNQFLFAPSTEGMSAATNCTRDSVWLVGHEYGTNKFYAYLISENGLNTNPVISNIGLPVMIYFGQMKFSPDSKKIATITTGEIFQFNFSNGTITNEIFVGFGGYGLSFSPDSKKLYFCSSGNLIGQYDITSNDPATIFNSYQTIYNGASNSEYWGLQLGGDNKIYIAAIDTAIISKIEYPNNVGISVNFNPYAVDLNGRKCQYALPNFIESYFNNDADTVCNENEFVYIPNVFTPNNDGINDIFTIDVQGYTELSYTIYNRWGNEIIHSVNQQIIDSKINLWDGNINEKNASDGVYYFVIYLKTAEDEVKIEKGFIHIFH